MQKTKIEWTDFTSNPIYAIDKQTGKRGWMCTKPSTGCAHCYAEAINKRFGNGLSYHQSSVSQVEFKVSEKELEAIKKVKAGNKVFVGDMLDIFHEAISFDLVDQIFEAMIESCGTFQILTKRPDRMKAYAEKFLYPALLPAIFENIWFGVSVENQEMADKRIPILLSAPVVTRWLSVEPLLGPIDLKNIYYDRLLAIDALEGLCGIPVPHQELPAKINWVVAGAESGAGHGTRPAQEQWFRDLKNQCTAANVPFFLKQFAVNGKKISLPIMDGQNWVEFPRIAGS